MKIIIAGSRTFKNKEYLFKACDQILRNTKHIEIVSGGAKGADQLGELYAKEKDYKLTRFLPDWKKYGKKAGPLRNEKMAKYADVLIAFWNGTSRGTAHIINIAKENKLQVRIIKF